MNRTEDYEKYREAGKDVNSNLMNSYLDNDMLMGSARLLGIVGAEDTLVFDTEEDMDVLMDFALNDYRQQERTAVEMAWDKQGWENEGEKDYLKALLRSYTSLFKVISINESENTIEIKDVLNEKSLKLTDIACSKSAIQGILLFFRLIPCGDFNMTSGVSFAFRGDTEDHLQTVYKQMSRTIESQPEPVKRYVSFYKLDRKYGLEVRYI
jgi:hypothetical protein